MIASGERLDLSGLAKPTVDKHSTGGVGDKISLIALPARRRLRRRRAAAVGPRPRPHRRHARQDGVHPGLAGDAQPDRDASTSSSDVGAVICAAGAGLAPADRKLYALRDVTGTVESIPLIASSIMSKKIAEGTGALVLDVKVGRGRVHEGRRAGAASWPRPWCGSATAHGVRTDRPAHRHGRARSGAPPATPSR